MESRLGLTGTDLGVSFLDETDPANKRLIFLFGDSWTTAAANNLWDADSAAWVSLQDRPLAAGRLPRLNWFRNEGGLFRPFRLAERPGKLVSLGGMEVPVEGISIGQRNYLFFSTGWNKALGMYCCSVMGVSEGSTFDPQHIDFISRTSTKKFVNISAFVKDGTVWIFGTGPYRNSSVFLARSSIADLRHRNRWLYFSRMEGTKEKFVRGEHKANPVLFTSAQARCIGELSVRPSEQFGYLMMFTCPNIKQHFGRGGPTQERGVHLLRADLPWGPWDKSINLLNPDVDNVYQHFMHRKSSALGRDDGLAEPGRHLNLWQTAVDPGHGWREEEYGGEYGAYQIPHWTTTRTDGSIDIYYTLSSWNPYQVHLMRTTLARHENLVPVPPPPLTGPPGPTGLVNGDWVNGVTGWTPGGDGASFRVFVGGDGVRRLTTHTTSKNEAAKGTLSQEFTVAGGDQALRFKVHGGDGQVRLYRADEVVRATRGRSWHEPKNDPNDTNVCWNIQQYVGQKLRLTIVDEVDGDYGYVGVTNFEFSRLPCGN